MVGRLPVEVAGLESHSATPASDTPKWFCRLANGQQQCLAADLQTSAAQNAPGPGLQSAMYVEGQSQECLPYAHDCAGQQALCASLCK